MNAMPVLRKGGEQPPERIEAAGRGAEPDDTPHGRNCGPPNSIRAVNLANRLLDAVVL